MKNNWKKISQKSYAEFNVEQLHKSKEISMKITHQDEYKIEYSCIVLYKEKKVIEDETVLAKILEKLEVIDGRLNKIENRLDNLEVRMDRLEERMDKLEVRMDKLEERMERVEQDIKDIKECPTIKKELEIVRSKKS